MNNMSDLRIKNSGSTANGLVSGSMPNGNLRVPEWKNVDVVGNLINMYYANEKNNRENEALQLGKAKQDLAEQQFAYNAFNDDIGRQMSLKLQEMQNQNAIAVKNAEFNANKKMLDENKRKNDMIMGAILDIQQRNKNGSEVVDFYHPEIRVLVKKHGPLATMNAFNQIMSFNSNMNNSNGVSNVNGGNVVGNGNANYIRSSGNRLHSE